MRTLLALIIVFVVALLAWPRNKPVDLETARRALDDGVVRAVVLGDSVARGAGDERGSGIASALDRQFGGMEVHSAPVINLGINGARTTNVRALLSRAPVRRLIASADVVVLSIGGNDLYGDSVSRIRSRFVPAFEQYLALARVEQIVERVRLVNPAAQIYVLGLYNPYRKLAIGRWLDQQVNLWDARLIAQFASANNVTMIRISDLLDRDDRISSLDHFHPGWKGYDAIAARIAAAL